MTDPEHNGWDDVPGPATAADIARLDEQVRQRMADAEVGPLLLRITELEVLLHRAFSAGAAWATASHRDFEQIHPDRATWVRKALGGLDA